MQAKRPEDDAWSASVVKRAVACVCRAWLCLQSAGIAGIVMLVLRQSAGSTSSGPRHTCQPSSPGSGNALKTARLSERMAPNSSNFRASEEATSPGGEKEK